MCQNTTTPKNAVSANEAAAATPDKYRFEIARDTRGREVTGLWVRNGRYYVQANIPGKGSRRFALLDAEHQPVKTLQEAQDAAMEFRKAKRDGELPDSRRAPLFSDYVDHYIKWLEETEAKSQLTINKESGALKGWKKHLGGIRLTQITRRMINDYVQERKKAGRNNRTANLDVIALGNLLKFAKDEGYLKAVITEDWKPLKYEAPKRELATKADLDKLVAEALRTKVDDQGKTVPVYQSGEQLADWLRLMQYSGARFTPAFTARWDKVDWQNRQLTPVTKYGKHAVVDFNPKLEAHLKDMLARRQETSPWLFPSPRNDGNEEHLTNLHKTLHRVKTKVGMPDFTPHDCRHHFISYAVMDGVDFMTIARWVAHSDGGVLIGRIYGHLSKGHMQKSAARLSFGQGQSAPKGAEQPQPPAPRDLVDRSKISGAKLLQLLQVKMNEQKAGGSQLRRLPRRSPGFTSLRQGIPA